MAGLPDSDKVVAAIREAAELDILPRFRRLERHEITEKNPGEVVTIADIEAEHRLTSFPAPPSSARKRCIRIRRF